MAQVLDREQKKRIFLSLIPILQENLIHLCAKFKYYIRLLPLLRDEPVPQQHRLSRIHAHHCSME
jgi:hypothetical protein